MHDLILRIRYLSTAGWDSVASFMTKSFQAKLLALVLLSVLVPSGVLWIFTVRDTERFQRAQTNEKFTTILGSAKREIDYWYKDRLGDLDRLFRSSAFVRNADRHFSRNSPKGSAEKELRKYLAIVNDKFPVYSEFVVLGPRGQVLVSTAGLTDHKLAMLDSLRGEAGPNGLISEPHLSVDGDEMYQWVLLPAEISNNARVIACVKMGLSDLTRLLKPDKFNATVDMYLVDGQGRFVTQPRTAPFDVTNGRVVSMLGEKAMELPVRHARSDQPIVERYTKEVLTKKGKKHRKKNFLGSKLYMPEYRWWVVCEAEESDVIAPVVTRKNRILLADVLICALFMLAAWKMSRYLLKPLAELSLAARRINKGLVAVQIPVAADDEIGDMISAFNDMAKRIGVTEAELQAKAKQLQGKNEQLVTVNDKLERLSITDGLTGLFNHRHFWNLMNSELTRANLYRGELGLVLLDIDDFKQVNDQFGHSSGDLLIQKISKVIKDTVRITDLVARYGGEEFAVLLPDTSRKGVLNVSEKVREAVEHTVFKVPDTDITLTVTVSIGVSVFRGNRREFFNAADRALYLSKSEGKNRVSFALAAK